MRDATDREIPRLTDYVTGEIPEADRALTRQWIAAHGDRSSITRDLEQVYAAVQASSADPSQESATTERVIQAVFSRIQRPHGSDGTQNVEESRPVPAIASPLTQPIRRYRRPWLWAGAGVLVFLLISGLGLFRSVRHQDASTLATTQEYIARPGEQVTVELVDGSQVTLAAGSRVRYSTGFGDADRTIYLSGRAFFDVTHDATLPFIVYAENSAVQVLGTSFVVSAYPTDTTVQVVVRDGKVALRTSAASNATGIALSAGDLGSLNRTGLVTVTPNVYVPQYTAWTERRLEFRKTTLSEIARELERRYNILVVVHPSLSNIPVTASFGNEPADQALERLAIGLRATVARDGRQYRITP